MDGRSLVLRIFISLFVVLIAIIAIKWSDPFLLPGIEQKMAVILAATGFFCLYLYEPWKARIFRRASNRVARCLKKLFGTENADMLIVFEMALLAFVLVFFIGRLFGGLPGIINMDYFMAALVLLGVFSAVHASST